jgi:hypothetical protein
MDIGFMLVSDKKFGFYAKNQRNLSFFSTFRWFLTELSGEIYQNNRTISLKTRALCLSMVAGRIIRRKQIMQRISNLGDCF